MKPNPLPALAALCLSGCALLAPSPDAQFHAAYAAMQRASAAGADRYDAGDMGQARQRYRMALQIKQHSPDGAGRLAEESRVLAELAQARTEAALAAQQRQSAQDEVTALERLAHPGGATR